jgi:hypothetical protein
MQNEAATRDHIPPCMSRARLKNEQPLELLNLFMWACAEREQFEQALFVYALSGVDGYYDALRVSDPSSHDAARLIRGVALQALGTNPERYRKFNAYVKSTLNDKIKRRNTCDAVRAFGPPTYFPQYMVDHGLDAIQANANKTQLPNRGLVANFDQLAEWNVALNGYPQCDTAR